MTEQKTIYLAGKITGDPHYYIKFQEATCKLEAAGFIVLNPAVLPPTGFTYEAYMRMSTAMLDECAAACFLPDWTDSNGAKYEFERAKAKDKHIFYFSEWEIQRSKMPEDE